MTQGSQSDNLKSVGKRLLLKWTVAVFRIFIWLMNTLLIQYLFGQILHDKCVHYSMYWIDFFVLG